MNKSAAGLFLLFFLLVPGIGNAGDLVVAFCEFPPYSFAMNGRPAGVDIEILQETASRMGVKLQYRSCTFEECMESMRTGTSDVMSSLSRTKTREKFIHFVQPSYTTASDQVFYVLQGQENRIRTYANLSGLKIGVTQGVDYFPRFDKDTSLNKVTARSFQELVSMLDNGMIDCFACSYSEGAFWLRVIGLGEVIVPAKFTYSSKQKLWMGLSKKSPNFKMLRQFRNALRSVVGDGSAQRFERRFVKR